MDAIKMELDELIDKIPLVAENILEEAAGQPMLYVDASRFRVEAMRKATRAKAHLEYLRSRVGMIVRQRMRANGEKPTEWAVKERVDVNKKVRLAIRALNDAEADEEFAKLLLDAFKQRRDAIRVTAESQLAEGTRQESELRYLDNKNKMREKAREVNNARPRRH
jgi:hypothetical protein